MNMQQQSRMRILCSGAIEINGDHISDEEFATALADSGLSPEAASIRRYDFGNSELIFHAWDVPAQAKDVTTRNYDELRNILNSFGVSLGGGAIIVFADPDSTRPDSVRELFRITHSDNHHQLVICS